jgi:hypothetical protein
MPTALNIYPTSHPADGRLTMARGSSWFSRRSGPISKLCQQKSKNGLITVASFIDNCGQICHYFISFSVPLLLSCRVDSAV